MTEHKRPWVAAVLAFLYPGLGHVYLRAWLRAFGWFTISFVVAYVAIATADVSLDGVQGIEGIVRVQEALPVEAALAIFAVSLLNIVDAYVVARRGGVVQAENGGTACPNCGKELDEDLAFCPWCTTRFDVDDSG